MEAEDLEAEGVEAEDMEAEELVAEKTGAEKRIGNDKMSDIRPSKKSESIEVRVPFEAKQAFIAACKAERRSASDVIRGAIAAYVDRRDGQPDLAAERKLAGLVPKSLRRKHYVALGAASVLGIAALAALPSAAAPSDPDQVAAFSKLDRNGDGFVSFQEFVAR